MYDWLELSSEVFVRRYESLDLNVGAILCGDGVVLVDTRGAHRQARELQSHLREITRLPVAAIVNTHHHWDHTFGNGAFSGVPIWGHERCAETLQARGEDMRQQVKNSAPQYADVFDEVVITPPDHIVYTTEAIKVGDRRIELRYLGRAHTDNDLVVVVPDADIVFAGDIIEESAPPNFGDSFPMEWPETVSALVGHSTGPVVPGHGAVVERHFVEGQHTELFEIRRLAAERHGQGMSVADAAALGGPYPNETLHAAFERAWLQLGGTS